MYYSSYIMISCKASSFFSKRIRPHQYRNAKANASSPQIMLFAIADIKTGFQDVLQKIISIKTLYLNDIHLRLT